MILAMRRRKPKPSYEPPEIEIETFQTPGVVPDLNAIEAAFTMGNSTKTIALIILSLEQRGIVNIVNRAPLQMEVLQPNAELNVYEKATIDAIQEDGTIDKTKIEAILAAVASVVQPKMWNADPETTRDTYRRRIESAREQYEREWREQPTTGPMPNYVPWVILHPSYGTPFHGLGGAIGARAPGASGARGHRPHRAHGQRHHARGGGDHQRHRDAHRAGRGPHPGGHSDWRSRL